jgi:photoactive yellow protein
MAVQKIEIAPESLIDEIGDMTEEQLDALPFGAIQLDEHGQVMLYNRTEEQLAGRSRHDVIGRNFFTDIAPCTRVRSFYGAFQRGLERSELNEVFDFSFHFVSGTREVRIRMIYAASPKRGVWIFVTPL